MTAIEESTIFKTNTHRVKRLEKCQNSTRKARKHRSLTHILFSSLDSKK